MHLFRSSSNSSVRALRSFPAASSVQVARADRRIWVGLQFLFDLFRSRSA